MNYLRLLGGYTMRSQLTSSITALALIFPLVFISCADNADNDNNNNTNQQPHAYTEHDFASDPNLAAHPDRKVVIVHLEPETADESSNLTGEIGFDVIPFNYTDATKQTFCWEGPIVDSAHVMKLLDSEGQELLSLGSDEGCATVILAPGRHEMHLIHDNRSDRTFMMFIKPNILEDKSYAQSPGPSPTELANLKKLISTSECVGCDLRYTTIPIFSADETCPRNPTDAYAIDLSYADLTGATLPGGAEWCYGSFEQTNLNEATIYNMEFFNDHFASADLSNSTSTSVYYHAVDFSGASFANAKVNDSDFFQAVLSPDEFQNNRPTDFTGATVDNTNFREVEGFKTVAFWNTKLTNCDLTGLDLSETFLFDTTDLTGSNLTATTISNVVMSNVTFDEVNFEQADLSGFACRQCTFKGANFKGADVQDINIDATDAIWTDGTCVCQDASCSNC